MGVASDVAIVAVVVVVVVVTFLFITFRLLSRYFKMALSSLCLPLLLDGSSSSLLFIASGGHSIKKFIL